MTEIGWPYVFGPDEHSGSRGLSAAHRGATGIPTPMCGHPECPQTLSRVPWGAKLLPLRSTVLDGIEGLGLLNQARYSEMIGYGSISFLFVRY